MSRSCHILTSWLPRVSELDGETILIILRWVRGDEAGKSVAGSIDEEKIAIRAVVPSQTDVRAGGLVVGCIHLENTRKCQKTRERIVRLEPADDDGEVPGWKQDIAERISDDSKLKSVPLLGEYEREPFACTIRGSNSRFVQMPVVIRAEPFEEIHHQPAVLCRSVSELMAGPVILADRVSMSSLDKTRAVSRYRPD